MRGAALDAAVAASGYTRDMDAALEPFLAATSEQEVGKGSKDGHAASDEEDEADEVEGEDDNDTDEDDENGAVAATADPAIVIKMADEDEAPSASGSRHPPARLAVITKHFASLKTSNGEESPVDIAETLKLADDDDGDVLPLPKAAAAAHGSHQQHRGKHEALAGQEPASNDDEDGDGNTDDDDNDDDEGEEEPLEDVGQQNRTGLAFRDKHKDGLAGAAAAAASAAAAATARAQRVGPSYTQSDIQEKVKRALGKKQQRHQSAGAHGKRNRVKDRSGKSAAAQMKAASASL